MLPYLVDHFVWDTCLRSEESSQVLLRLLARRFESRLSAHVLRGSSRALVQRLGEVYDYAADGQPRLYAFTRERFLSLTHPTLSAGQFATFLASQEGWKQTPVPNTVVPRSEARDVHDGDVPAGPLPSADVALDPQLDVHDRADPEHTTAIQWGPVRLVISYPTRGKEQVRLQALGRRFALICLEEEGVLQITLAEGSERSDEAR